MMKLMVEGRASEITGKGIMHLVAENLYVSRPFEASSECVEKNWKKYKKGFEGLLERMRKLRQSRVVIFDSKVTDDFMTIYSFFEEDKPMKDVRLLYRASEHDFSAN